MEKKMRKDVAIKTVIGYHNGVWKGSGRSLPGINLKEILDSCSEMFEGHGGHAAAVGVTLKEEYLETAPKLFDEACKRYLAKHKVLVDQDRLFDAKLKAKAVTRNICEVLNDSLYPYCKEHNVEPLFKLTNVNVVEANYIEKDTWRLLKFYVEKLEQKKPH